MIFLKGFPLRTFQWYFSLLVTSKPISLSMFIKDSPLRKFLEFCSLSIPLKGCPSGSCLKEFPRVILLKCIYSTLPPKSFPYRFPLRKCPSGFSIRNRSGRLCMLSGHRLTKFINGGWPSRTRFLTKWSSSLGGWRVASFHCCLRGRFGGWYAATSH